jgi:multidrug efflux pump subunit AcrA (membrane-fusion protein)
MTTTHTGARARGRAPRVGFWLRVAVGWVAVALVMASVALAQNYGNYNPRDDQYRLLGMTRAQAEYESALRDYQRQQQLRAQNLISDADLEHARTTMETARVNYLQAALAIVFATPHVIINRALKYQGRDGRPYVRLTLRNESQTSAEGVKLSTVIDSALLRELHPEEIPDVFVSLKDDSPNGGVIISLPYERRIPVLRFGSPVTLDFRLLKDVDAVTVSASYANQTSERRVLLEKDASANIVSVQSSQFSQEADLGGTATYDLALERFTSDLSGFRLEVGGLPREIHSEFRDPATSARLTQLRFPEGTTSLHLSLVLTLPERSAGTFQLDRPLSFWVFVLDNEAAVHYDRLARDSITAATAASVRAGKVRLELIPRGVGQLEVRTANLYREVTRGDSVIMDFTLRNTGSRVVDNARLTADVQPDWRATVTPDLVRTVPIDGEARVRVVLVPPHDVGVGDYDIKVRTDALSAERRVDTEDKTVRVHVSPPANWLGTVALIALLLGLVGGIVVFGLKLTRR